MICISRRTASISPAAGAVNLVPWNRLTIAAGAGSDRSECGRPWSFREPNSPTAPAFRRADVEIDAAQGMQRGDAAGVLDGKALARSRTSTWAAAGNHVGSRETGNRSVTARRGRAPSSFMDDSSTGSGPRQCDSAGEAAAGGMFSSRLGTTPGMWRGAPLGRPATRERAQQARV